LANHDFIKGIKHLNYVKIGIVDPKILLISGKKIPEFNVKMDLSYK
jgi:hypothetical protein